MKISRSIYINSLSIIILLGQIIVLPLLSQIYCTLTDNISSIGYEHEFLLQEQLQELGIPFMGEWLQHGMQCESGSQSLPSMLAHTFSRTFAMEIVIFNLRCETWPSCCLTSPTPQTAHAHVLLHSHRWAQSAWAGLRQDTRLQVGDPYSCWWLHHQLGGEQSLVWRRSQPLTVLRGAVLELPK